MSNPDPILPERLPDGAETAADGAPSAVPPAPPSSPAPPAPPAPATDVSDLERIAEPAVVRRAPRYGAFIRTGVVLGIIIGWMVAAAPPSAPDESRASVIGFTVFGLAVLGALLGAGFAVVADRRSHRGS